MCAEVFSDVCVVVVPGGEASGPGQTGVAQHPQEADGLPAGSAGDRRGEEIRQVAVRECPRPSPVSRRVAHDPRMNLIF